MLVQVTVLSICVVSIFSADVLKFSRGFFVPVVMPCHYNVVTSVEAPSHRREWSMPKKMNLLSSTELSYTFIKSTVPVIVSVGEIGGA